MRWPETVVPFSAVDPNRTDADALEILPAGRQASPFPTPPMGVRTVKPGHDEQHPVSPSRPPLRAAPTPPGTTGLDTDANPTWLPDGVRAPIDDSDVPTTLDDSRLPTDESSLHGAVTAVEEPGIGLNAAVTRTDEPGVFFDEDQTVERRRPSPALGPIASGEFLEGETEETEQFFTNEPTSAGPGGIGVSDIDDEIEWRSRRSPALTIGAAVLLGMLVIGVGLIAAVSFFPGARTQLGMAPVAASDVDEAPSLNTELAPSDAGGEDAGAPAPAPDVVMPEATADPEPAEIVDPPAEVAEADPQPAVAEPDPPKAKVAPPRPPAPRPTVYDTQVKAGWSGVESNPDSAADAFRAALDQRPGDTEASYGLGYAMLKLGQKNGARAYLCAASGTADPATRQEIAGILASAGLACE